MNAKDLVFVHQINVVRIHLDHIDVYLSRPDVLVDMKELGKTA